MKRVAISRAKKIALKLEEYWSQLRWDNGDIPAAQLLKPLNRSVPSESVKEPVATITLNDAKDLYLKLKGQGKNKTFNQTTNRSVAYVIELLGNKPICSYKKADANKFRDHLIAKKLTIGSVKRIVSVVRSVINFAISETGLETVNSFNGLYYGSKNDVQKREPVPDHIRIQLQRKCVELNDQPRWLIALISDTGMRLREAVGLHVTDIHLNEKIPYVHVRPHDWRGLKTQSSDRRIPLYGASLWAAHQIVAHSKNYAFSKYCDGKVCNSNSASGALNKWMSGQINGKYVIHGFRHGLRDRLRKVECPFDIADQIGGWKTNGVGQGYGNGYPLSVLAKWMNTINSDTGNGK
nr:tyrosine-type recombinase/integrase [Candidatus Terasakiella magnetica]